MFIVFILLPYCTCIDGFGLSNGDLRLRNTTGGVITKNGIAAYISLLNKWHGTIGTCRHNIIWIKYGYRFWFQLPNKFLSVFNIYSIIKRCIFHRLFVLESPNINKRNTNRIVIKRYYAEGLKKAWPHNPAKLFS